jgi:hypothetical protein
MDTLNAKRIQNHKKVYKGQKELDDKHSAASKLCFAWGTVNRPVHCA